MAVPEGSEIRATLNRPWVRSYIIPENKADRDLEHGSGSSVDIVTPAASGDLGNGVRIETSVLRIAGRLPVPSFLVHVGSPIRADACADIPPGARRPPIPSPASVSDQVHQTSYPYEEAFKQDTGAIHQKALWEFTMPFPPIFRDLFGRRLPGEAGDARSEISEADRS